MFDAYELFEDLEEEEEEEEEEETGKPIDVAALADDQSGVKHYCCLDNNSGRDKEDLAIYPRYRYSWNAHRR